ncbi:MAG: ferredoxin [Planctomycetes bacterium]|nr:ferredoxin [Planctomycetota bacterium]
MAPKNCRVNEANWSCEVFKQPESPEEDSQLRDAMDMSCVQCIHDDGDDEWGQPPHETPPKP